MGKIRFEVGARYKLGGQTYIVKRLLPHDELVIENESTGIESTVQRTVLKVFGAATVDQDVTLSRQRTTRVLERVEIDHVVLDVMIVDDEHRLALGRPTLTCAIDDYSGMPVGLSVSFEPPNHEGDASCISHGILPKGDVQKRFGTKNPWPVYGVPERLILDNSKAFSGSGLVDACRQLGITVERLRLRSPRFKSSIERAFRTINVGLLRELPDTSSSDQPLESGEKQDEASQQQQYPLIAMSGFMAALLCVLLDIYAQSWNAARGCVPAKRWYESIAEGHTPMMPGSAEEVSILFAPTATRTLQRTGIEFERLRYNSPELAQLGSSLGTDKRVSIKFDPSDLGQIYASAASAASVDSAGATGGWLAVPALHQDYAARMSLWEHRALIRYARAAKDVVDIYALSEAKLRLQQLVRGEFASASRRSVIRRKAARVLDNGPTNLHPVDASESAPLSKGSEGPQLISPEPEHKDEAGTSQS